MTVALLMRHRRGRVQQQKRIEDEQLILPCASKLQLDGLDLCLTATDETKKRGSWLSSLLRRPPKAKLHTTVKRCPGKLMDLYSGDTYMEDKTSLSPFVLPVYHQHFHRTILNATSELLMNVQLQKPHPTPPPTHFFQKDTCQSTFPGSTDEFSDITLIADEPQSPASALAMAFSPKFQYLTWWYMLPHKKSTPWAISSPPRSISIKTRNIFCQ
ncbi:hypothetical protein DM01DRAFT_1373755 [Hesseltinella vesiculosa]|uniref:Uncharacterized protein n=1 Tax=Hesseltinella vesiculosa TaxID=101127 RepID=A0A1X2GJH6_9FUNG|nr:hypothetical protein DM01DRAFT_1373755 [Hesseltinella vesiculosa]